MDGKEPGAFSMRREVFTADGALVAQPAPAAVAPRPPDPPVRPLSHLALRALLLVNYDDESRRQIEGALLSSLPFERIVPLVAEPAVFGALAGYPALLDALRSHFASRPKGGRRVLEELIARDAELSGTRRGHGFGDRATVECACAMVVACERLLCTGMFKRDIRGALLPTELANLVRALRKASHRRIPADDGIGHWRPSEPSSADASSWWRSGQQLALLARAQAGGLAVRAGAESVSLKRLDQHTG